ncbi:hypothetical protein ACO0RG_000098 [Hanseniaspora osmophila]
MDDLDKLITAIEEYLQKQKYADINATRALCTVIAKVFIKTNNGVDTLTNKELFFTQSVGNLNSSLKKVDLGEMYRALTTNNNEIQRKEDQNIKQLDHHIVTQQNNESKSDKPVLENKSVFKKRKKFVVTNLDPLPNNNKLVSTLVDDDNSQEEDEEEGITTAIMFNRNLATKRNITKPTQTLAENQLEKSAQNDFSQLESEIETLNKQIKQCLSTSNKHFQNSKGSTSYIENEHFKLTPVSLKERLQLVPPFLQTLNESYMPLKTIGNLPKNNSNYLLDIIMGSLLPNSSASRDGSHTDLIEGKLEISNDENGELTQSCQKSSKMLINYKKVIEQKKHVKNIVLNDTLQKVSEQNNSDTVQEEHVIDDDEIMNTEEEDEEEDNSDDKSQVPLFVDNSRSLPVYACKQDFLKVLQENQVVLVIGETGSGKTTQLPKYIYEQDRQNHKIAITQPRRVAAMTIAQRIGDELRCDLGKEVGYAVRFDDKTDKKITRIKVLTDGILLREFLTMTTSTQIDYTHIIIDEAHERSLNTDVLLGFIKQLLLRKLNRTLKIIITSATINFKTFLQNFPNAPVFKIPGKTFPVQPIYLKRPAMDYIETVIQTIVKLHLSNPVEENNDILCFMTGQDDIEISCAMLKDKLTQVYAQAITETPAENHKNNKNFAILPLYSTLSPKKQALVFQKFPKKRKIIFCTNIAETSITIDGIKFVVDAGFHKLKLYNSKIGLNILKTVPISKDMSVQRQGRAGRTQPGVVYKMYTESCFNFELLKNSIPEIKRTNLSNVLLMLLSAQEGSCKQGEFHDSVGKILKFPFIEKPSKLTLLSSFLELYNLNAVDNAGNLTSLGLKMSKVPITPNLSKMLILSKTATFECFEEIVIIVGMLSIESNSGASFFQRPKNFEKLADSKRLNFIVPYSDHLTLLNLYSKWNYNNRSLKWCERNFINHKSLVKVEKIVEQLKGIANGIGGTMPKNSRNANHTSNHHKNTWENVKKCVTTGYSYKNIGKKIGLNKYISLQNGMTLQIHPTSSLFGLPDLPPYIIYHDLLLTSKEYINCVTAVDPVWIMEYQPLYFNIHVAVSEENGEIMHSANDSEQLEALQNLRKYSVELLEKQKSLAVVKSQLAKEKTQADAQQEEQRYMSTVSSLKTFKKRKKMGF